MRDGRILHSRFTRDLPYRVTVSGQRYEARVGLARFAGIVRGPWLPPPTSTGESAGVLSNGHPDSGFLARLFRAFGHFIWAKMTLRQRRWEARVGSTPPSWARHLRTSERGLETRSPSALLLVNTHRPCPPRHDQHAQKKPTLIKGPSLKNSSTPRENQ